MALRCPTEEHRQEWSLRLNSIQHGWCRVAVLSWWSHLSGKFQFCVYREKEEKREKKGKRKKKEERKNKKRVNLQTFFLFLYPPNSERHGENLASHILQRTLSFCSRKLLWTPRPTKSA